jgi:hypothetical protein
MIVMMCAMELTAINFASKEIERKRREELIASAGARTIDFCEKEISINDMRIENNLLIYGENNIKERYDPALTYEQLKTKYIKKIFSNDDQIALILNKDKSPEDLELFNKMQEWRD